MNQSLDLTTPGRARFGWMDAAKAVERIYFVTGEPVTAQQVAAETCVADPSSSLSYAARRKGVLCSRQREKGHGFEYVPAKAGWGDEPETAPAVEPEADPMVIDLRKMSPTVVNASLARAVLGDCSGVSVGYDGGGYQHVTLRPLGVSCIRATFDPSLYCTAASMIGAMRLVIPGLAEMADLDIDGELPF